MTELIYGDSSWIAASIHAQIERWTPSIWSQGAPSNNPPSQAGTDVWDWTSLSNCLNA